MSLNFKALCLSAAVLSIGLAGCGGAEHSATVAEPAISNEAASALKLSSDDVEANPTAPTYSRDRYNLEAVIYRLRDVAAPLFQHYGLKFGEDFEESSAFHQMLSEVSFDVKNGIVTVTNKATGGVIFTGRLNDVASGVFTPENIPGGVVTPPPPSACTYAYSAWGACQPDNTQTRTVASSSPAGCTGTPLLSQACTYVPPPPSACTYAYSAWGACQSTNTQTRTVASSSPAGCTGTPLLSQSCTYVPPPPPACTYTSGAWGACQPDGTQTRTVSASPSGCTGTPPASSQSCTYVPPVVTCTGFTYNSWTPAVCPSSGTQSRTVATSSPAGCTGGTPVLSQACTYVPPVVTCTSFTYSAWGTCSASGSQSRTVTSSAPAGCTGGSPVLTQSCTPPVTNPVTTANVVSSCTGCHGLTSNTTVFRSGGYTVSGRSSAQWLSTVNNMVGLGASLASGTTAQNYADYLAGVP